MATLKKRAKKRVRKPKAVAPTPEALVEVEAAHAPLNLSQLLNQLIDDFQRTTELIEIRIMDLQLTIGAPEL